MSTWLWQKRFLSDAHRYKFALILGRHPEQTGKRDPRKVWMYDCMSGSFSAEDDMSSDGRVYYFANETDFLLFKLRWEHDAKST